MSLQVNNLIGFGVQRGKGVLSEVSLTGSALSDSGNYVLWPTVEPGDVAVFYNRANGSGATPDAVTPTGFTTALSLEYGVRRFITSWRLCDGTETGAIYGMTTNVVTRRVFLLIFRGNVPVQTVTLGTGVGDELTSNDPTPRVIPSGSGTPPLLTLGVYSCATAPVYTRSFTPAKDGEVGIADARDWVAWKFFLESPSNVTVDMPDSGSNNYLAGLSLEVT